MPVPVDPTGLCGPTPAAARGPQWRRTSCGLFVPADVDADLPTQRIVEAAGQLPPYGGVTGWAALCWMGGRWFDGSDGRPVVLATGPGNLRASFGRAVSKERLAPFDLTGADGLPVTAAVRSVCFEMRYAVSAAAAARTLELAAFSDLVSVEECRAYVAGYLAAWTGVQQCRDALPLVDENAWSPTEFSMRQIWVGAGGRPPPLCNRPVFDRMGRHLGTPDLIDPVAGVVGEYEGSLHLTGRQRASDLAREELFRSHGLEGVTMVAADLRDPRAFLQRLDSAYARAARLPISERRWTLAQPAWWTPTETVAQRRALGADLRRRLLAHRAG